MVAVLIPSQLQAYCGSHRVEAVGPTVAAVLDDLDRQFRGVKFRVIDEQGRIRPHMRIFVGREAVAALSAPVADGDEVMIFGALSGG